MELSLVDFLIGLAAICLALTYYLKADFDYWKRKKIPNPKPQLVFGNVAELILGKLSIGEQLKKIYDQFPNEPLVGFFIRSSPRLMLCDPDLIRDVLVRDFGVWSDRGQTIHEAVEPLSVHLFNLEPRRWKPIRAKLTPTFTSGKLKEMFYLVLESAEGFVGLTDRLLEKSDDGVVEVREVAARFATDVIGACAFGLKMNALNEEESTFRKMGKDFVTINYWKRIKFQIREALPWLYTLLKPITYNYELNDFFLNTMAETIKFRRENKVRRNDFVDLLMDIQANPSKINDIEMSHALLTAQAFVFFVAGYETSSSAMSNALYELALHPEMQTKLRAEIVEELKKSDGKLTYEGVKNMKYLHKVFCESLRKYPSLMMLTRKSTEDYTFRGTKVTVPKGMKVFIPVYALHRDPKIYPNPDVFDPERFTEDNIAARHPSHYLNFGDGPRNCIGARFGIYQTKVGIVTFLLNYELSPCKMTKVPIEHAPTSLLFAPKGGIKLHLKRIKTAAKNQ